MARKRFRKLADGEWSAKSRKRKNGFFVQKIKCCDCGLVHLMQYEITARGLRFRAWRETRRKK
jgi:hypothetical protein